MKANFITIALITFTTYSCLSQSFEQGAFTGLSLGGPELQDINNDEKIDVIGLEKNGFGSVGNLVMYINNSNVDSIAFDVVDLEIRGIGAASVADLDGDNDLDIVISEWDGSNAIVLALYNDGNLQFSRDTISLKNLYRHSLADLDGDGDLDIVSSNRDNDIMQIHFNEGNREFSEGASLEEDDLHSVALDDLDNDGDIDIILGFDDFFNSDFTMWNNNGSGEFEDQPIVSGSFGNLSDFKVIDIDNDGVRDIVYFGRNSISLRVILQSTIGVYQERELVSSPNVISGFSVSNFDSEYGKDVLIGGDNQGDVTFHLNTENDPFGFEDFEIVSGISPASFIEPSDLDGDGDLDVVVSNGDFWWLENNLNQGTVNVIDINDISLEVYPNPFNQEIFINKMKEEQSLEIFNSIGSRIFKIDTPIQKLDLSNYNTGIYFLKITNNEGLLSSTYRIIKK
jgi:hypothetical protein